MRCRVVLDSEIPAVSQILRGGRLWCQLAWEVNNVVVQGISY